MEPFHYMTKGYDVGSYILYPRWLLNVNLPETTKLIYVLLLDRSRMSVDSGGRFLDEQGRAFVIFTISQMKEAAHRKESTIKAAYRSLQNEGMIEKQLDSIGGANRIYVKLPAGAKNQPGGGQKIDPLPVRKSTPSKNRNQDRTNNTYDYSCTEKESL